jgi:hypothetical protein
MRNKQIDIAIDETHLKSDKQVIPHVQQKIKDATPEEIKNENKSRPKDNNPHVVKNYYINIFSPHRFAYQIDLLEQSKDRDKTKFPHYYFMAININTKFAYAYPIESKKQNVILDVIKQFTNDTKVISIVSDEEGSFRSNIVVDYLTQHHISLKIITEQRHTPLALIDRLIRELRDMNTPTVKGLKTSENERYRDFTNKRMQKLIKIYNDTINSSINMTPNKMENDEKLEKSYIIQKLYERERRTKLTDFDLKDKTKVRYILERNPLMKHRYKISPEYYEVCGKDGLSVIIMAKDGTTKTISRWRLFPVHDSSKLKFGKSFNNNMGELKSIDGYDRTTKKYDVTFAMPDNTTFKDKISAINLRGSNPQIQTEMEKKYWLSHRVG